MSEQTAAMDIGAVEVEAREDVIEAPNKSGAAARSFGFRAALPPRIEVAIAVGFSLLLLLAWEVSVRMGWVNSLFFPPPSVVLSRLWEMTAHEDLLYQAGVSTLRVWVAFGLSVVLAVPIGIVMSSYRLVGAALEPVVDFIRYLPVPALVPLSIIWLGVGEETKIFLLWLGTFFQLVLLIADDARRTPNEYVEIAYTVGAKPRQILTDVCFRSMLPNMFDSFRITLGWCWTYLIIAEIVAADSGLGFVIWTARRYMHTADVMAGVVAIGIIGLVTDQILRRLHKRLFRYL